VLAQIAVRRLGERADERVGEDDARDELVAEGARERLAERALEQRLPRAVVVDELAQLIARAQWLDERRKRDARDAAGHRVETLPRAMVALTARHAPERRERRGAIARVYQQPMRAAGARIGRVGGDRAARE